MITEKETLASEVLNDLLKINNDRIEGYKKGAAETKDQDLKILFEKMRSESKRIASALTNAIVKQGGQPDTGDTTNAGKIYRAWMDVKATFNGKDRKGILSACEFGEDAAQKAYRSALDEKDLPIGIQTLIKSQQIELKLSHDAVKALRDIAK